MGKIPKRCSLSQEQGTQTLNKDVTPASGETNDDCCGILKATVRIYENGIMELL
jgi:hypothetical protein